MSTKNLMSAKKLKTVTGPNKLLTPGIV
jgi:hypothetical protein